MFKKKKKKLKNSYRLICINKAQKGRKKTHAREVDRKKGKIKGRNRKENKQLGNPHRLRFSRRRYFMMILKGKLGF